MKKKEIIKPTFEKVSAEETKKFEKGVWGIIFKNKEKIDNFKIVLLAIFIGLFGGIIGNFLYDLSKEWDTGAYWVVNIVIIILFLVLVGAVLLWLKSYDTSSKLFQKSLQDIRKYGLKKLKFES